jgi:hypothetical protein
MAYQVIPGGNLWKSTRNKQEITIVYIELNGLNIYNTIMI